ncbi:MAG: hypothetical protein AB8B81_14560 [Halioglobus sp.]
MSNTRLANWASVAGIVGTIATVVALLFVINGMRNNTAAITALSQNSLFNELREIDLNTLNNPDLLSVTSGAKEGYRNLTEIQKEQYKVWLGLYVDLWDQARSLSPEPSTAFDENDGWNGYFIKWARRHVSVEVWQEIKWGWEAGFADYVEAAIST